MLKNKIFKVLFIGLVLLQVACSSAKTAKMIGEQEPATRFTLIDGDQVTINSYKGKPLVLMFWAMNCNQSPRAMERINAFVGSGRAKEATFLAVSLDKAEDYEELKEFLKYRELNHFKHAFSGNESADEAYLAFQGSQIPLIVIIDAAGKIVAVGDDSSVVENYFA